MKTPISPFAVNQIEGCWSLSLLWNPWLEIDFLQDSGAHRVRLTDPFDGGEPSGTLGADWSLSRWGMISSNNFYRGMRRTLSTGGTALSKEIPGGRFRLSGFTSML